MNTRPRLRRPLLSAGILPALLVLALAVRIALMLQHDSAGRDAFERGDYDGSRAEFADNRTLNLLERWIAPFDEGTTHHAEGQYDDAIADYRSALDHVPHREECTVRINLALAHESVGDELVEQGDRQGAIESWQAGVDALAAGDCPASSGRGEEQTRDAKTVDERLRQKMEQQREEQQQDRPPPPQPQPQDPQETPPRDPRQQQLERNNERGLQQRREDRELYEGSDYSRPYTW